MTTSRTSAAIDRQDQYG